VCAHARGIDAEAGERATHVVAERIVADLRHHRRPAPEPCRRDGDVRRAAAQHLPKGAHLRERDADLLGIEVDRHAANRQHLRGHSEPETRA
jgi:hypothetical protein